MAPTRLPRATLEQKIQILDFYHQSNRPQSETVDRYKNQLSISTSSFSEWLKNEDELRARLARADASFTKKSRRKVKFKYEKINRAMDLLVQQKLERGETINEPLLREHWLIYAHQYGVDDPKRLVGFSHGWLAQFKKRHGLSKKRISDAKDGQQLLHPATAEARGSSRARSQPQALALAQQATTAATANGEMYDQSFAPDSASAAAEQDPSYELMNQSQPQFRPNQPQTQPNMGYAPLNYSNYPMYPLLLLPQNTQNSGSVPFEYSDQFRQFPKDLRATANSTKATTSSTRRDEVGINGSDIERFIFMFADKYFHDNAAEYPQTVKVFQDFKTVFLNERIQSMRSIQPQTLSQHLVGQMSRPSPSQMLNIDEFFLRSGGLPQPQSANEHDKWRK